MMKKTAQKLNHVVLSVSVLAIAGIESANAALPASVGSTITAIQADGQSIFDLVFPVVGVFVGLAVVMKLFKRFSNKV